MDKSARMIAHDGVGHEDSIARAKCGRGFGSRPGCLPAQRETAPELPQHASPTFLPTPPRNPPLLK